jgi:gluconokinase
MSMGLSVPQSKPARIIIVMGVSSSGKTTVGQSIARRLHVPFLDGDDYHPAANVEKMRAGTPLTDEDRWPWLESFAKALHDAANRKNATVGACSALKRAYRDHLIEKAGEPILFVYLEGDRQTIAERMSKRSHAYMPVSLLDSQFAALEAPNPEEENALVLPVTHSVEKLTQAVTKELSHLRVFKRWQ